MPVHFKVAPHEANPVQAKPVVAPAQLFYSEPHQRGDLPIAPPRILQSTLSGRNQSSIPPSSIWSQASQLLGIQQAQASASPNPLSNLVKRKNGFVDTIVSAYSDHQHLVLRPDDVWIAILSQLNIYVNHHAEELRSHFVAHEGQKELSVIMESPIDFVTFAKMMSQELAKNVVDEELTDWVLPDFTTTTSNDTVVCAVMMMSTLKAYFTYRAGGITCGLPSVTLEGEREDWEKLLARIDKLKAFGPEPTQWTTLLLPILLRFVQAFDGKPDVKFWNHVYSVKHMGSGMSYITGWLTAFCVWDEEGCWRGSPHEYFGRYGLAYSLDEARYPAISLGSITPGSCEVDVTVEEEGCPPQACQMVAGHMASFTDGAKRDTLRPFPAWFIFEKPEVASEDLDD